MIDYQLIKTHVLLFSNWKSVYQSFLSIILYVNHLLQRSRASVWNCWNFQEFLCFKNHLVTMNFWILVEVMETLIQKLWPWFFWFHQEELQEREKYLVFRYLKNDGHIFGKTIGLKWEVINKIIKWLIKRLVQISASLKGDFL